MLGIDKHTGRIVQSGLASLENSRWRYVPSCRSKTVEDEDRLAHVVGYVKFSSVRVQRHVSRPVQLCLVTLNHSQRGSVSACAKRVDINGRRIKPAGTGFSDGLSVVAGNF